MTDKAKQYQQLIAKCWADDAFKQRLLADPAGTLKVEGLEVPKGVSIRVLENTAQVFNLVIPLVPTDISDEGLVSVGGGGETVLVGAWMVRRGSSRGGCGVASARTQNAPR